MSSTSLPPFAMPSFGVPEFRIKHEPNSVTMPYLQASTVGTSDVSGTVNHQSYYRSDARKFFFPGFFYQYFPFFWTF
jgi:hypothetical protein